MKKTLSPARKLLLAGGLLSLSVHASAAPTSTAAPCGTTDVEITQVSQYSGTTSNATLNTIYNGNMAAAACAGAFSGNDGFYPSTNLGYAGDGLLNGGIQNQSGAALFPGGAFITPQSPLQDLDKNGQVNDPGWIMLGKFEQGNNGSWGFTPSTVGGSSAIVLSSFFTATITGQGTGTWSFTPDATVAQRTSSLLGRNYFDQFALVFKAGNAFSVYDFTPAEFGMTAPKVTDPVMNWSGTYDVSDTLKNGGGGGAGLSHISLWVRDPAPTGQTSQVPEPSTLALVGLSAVALIRSRRKAA